MKKCFCILALMVLFLGGCNNAKTDTVQSVQKQEEVNSPQEAYNNINKAYEIVDTIGWDIYEGWRIGIFEAENVNIELLEENTSLTQEEIRNGIISFIAQAHLTNDSSKSLEECKKIAEKEADNYFEIFGDDSATTACMYAIVYAYEEKGAIEEANKLLSDAKVIINNFNEDKIEHESYSG